MTEPINPQLSVTGLVKKYGGFTALNGVGLELNPGERLGIIGPNGSGKSTLVNCITGVTASSAGCIQFQGSDITRLPPHERAHRGLVRTFQLPRPFWSLTLLDNVSTPLLHRPGANSAEVIRGVAARALCDVGLGRKLDVMPDKLTQVELRKLELAKGIATSPHLLIADEAMAGLSGSEVDEILDLLLKFNSNGTSVIMIEHIMRAVTRFSQRLIVIVAGEKIADGVPDNVLALSSIERAYLGQ
ncbi:ABC transporter ATP-binding protein [Allopusillimonas ginsengisoli]|uniref:ABC transporter ATP-binding protein n=1 Tax=Allopusillimonas ginsengisoli TaxID=453575 RepID=UPI00101EC78A|nr:ABC transporter ATP-binding protein [Allopusillimonas ginsengisoli]TEA79005.1 ABC transporter ATP-binding protein [Allopusillimonas ginsengisoli]